MSYSDLTEHEQHIWDEYGTLRAITDWGGFTEAQDNRKRAARDWLVNQRKQIWRCAEGKDPDCDPGWSINNRQARYDTLKDDNLNTATAKHEYTLPANGCTPTEKAYVEEREGYLMIGGDGASADERQRDRKTANVDWLVARRGQLYGLIQDNSEADNADNYRHQRYENLSIATHYGDAWAKYEREHNKYGQTPTPDTGGAKGSARAAAVDLARSYVGVHENPDGSNRGAPQPDGWEKRVYGSSGVPWCACFTTCISQDAGASGGASAAVEYCVSMAKNRQGIYRGWTTDPGAVLRGDHAVIGCSGCHIGVVASSDDPWHTIEGNTSPTSGGSQYNGGVVAEKHRGKGEIVGWCLVDYPD